MPLRAGSGTFFIKNLNSIFRDTEGFFSQNRNPDQDAQTAIENGGLDEFVQKLNAQIQEIVYLVRGKLPAGIRITLSATVRTRLSTTS